MDSVTFHKLTTRPNFLKDHNFKYIEFTATIDKNLSILREIAESLPEGKRRGNMTEIIAYLQKSWQEVLKDYSALQEGSAARNLIEDLTGTLISKESEIKALTDLSQKLTQRLKDANA